MKRFIIISLLAIITKTAIGCIWCESHNYYLFHIYTGEEFTNRVENICNANWKAYVGSTNEYYWFDAEKVIAVAQEKNDPLMVSYIQNLQKYLDCAKEVRYESWDYPTKEDIANREQTLKNIREYALSKTKSRLRSQHSLLLMRCNMMLGKHQENVTFWEQTASQLIETVYKDMMKDIYAGALYKTGKDEKAGEIFAELGDYNSLMTQYYKRRSFAAIRQEYLKNPNAKVLPFLLQDFVNNSQEAFDVNNPDASGEGKLFIRDITQKEALQMRDFCQQVVNEGKTETPIMWKSAQAWLEFMFGNKKQSATDIIEASSLAGTEQMKTCARSLMLYITSSQAKDSEAFDKYLVGELQWLEENKDLYHVSQRVVHQVLNKHYAHQPNRVIAIYKSVNSYYYYSYIDTMKVEGLEKYLYYTNLPGQNELDSYLKDRAKEEPYIIEDLIGTKYMRLCQWDKAIEWFKNIPISYYEDKGYAVYAAFRSYDIEPWTKRQFLEKYIEYSDKKWRLRENPKLKFATEMLQMESGLQFLRGQALEKSMYELAIRYSQAHFKGDCWWLMRDSKSAADTLRVNEVDLGAKSLELLRQLCRSTNRTLKEKALFACCYGDFYSDCWYNHQWNTETKEYDREPAPASLQYQAYQRLYNFEKDRTDIAEYVSRCDEYIQFKKLFK